MPLKTHLGITTLFVLVAGILPLLAQDTLSARWLTGLKQADKNLRAQRWAEAGKQARRVADEMVDNVGTGSEAAHSLAVVAAVLAIAEAGLGHQEDAEWIWDSGLNLDSGIAQTDVSAYGPAAAELRMRTLRPAEKTSGDNGDVEPPRIIHKTQPEYPEALRLLGATGNVVVSAIIGTDGRPRQPLILDAHEGGPALKYAALDSLRQWRFEPAKRDGKPQAVYYELMINFKQRKR